MKTPSFPMLRISGCLLLMGAFIFFLSGSSANAQGTGLIPNGGFEDSSTIGQHWNISYGERSLEDSIALKGDHSLMLEEVEDHIDLSSGPIGAVDRGTFELSFWYRAFEGSEEWAPIWVEVLQEGRAIKVYRIGKEKARMRKLSRDWLLFNGSFELSSGAPVRIFIHSDLPRIWLEDISLVRDEGV